MRFGNETVEQGSHARLDRLVEARGTLVDTADGGMSLGKRTGCDADSRLVRGPFHPTRRPDVSTALAVDEPAELVDCFVQRLPQ